MREALKGLFEVIRPTTWIRSQRLDDRLGCELWLASETFQVTGSFKFRAAFNLARNVSQSHIITASSGNFGQALAFACRLAGKRCTVVMPQTSSKVKVEAVMEYGGEVELVDVNAKSRLARVKEIAVQHPNAYVASAFDDDLVIQGNASLAFEIAESGIEFDAVIVPVGGGGLSSGLVMGFAALDYPTHVFGAEPLMANDAARSFREGELLENHTEPQTIADGARTVSLGVRNWEILRNGLDGIIEVPDENIARAVQDLFLLANLKSEPTGALSYAALALEAQAFQNRKVCCVVSGGNVDPARYAQLIA